MKTKLKQLLLTAIALVTLAATAQAKDDYTKVLEQEFKLKKDTRVEIFNKYGDVTIKDWEQSSIKIIVTITVEARSEDKAKSVFDKIEINLLYY